MTEILDAGTRTLRELADEANREHDLVVDAGIAMIDHAIAAGDALLLARQHHASGKTWMRWLGDNFSASHGTAIGYMRVATHKDVIREALGQPALGEALRYIRGLSPVGGPHGKPQFDEAEMRRLSNEGLSYIEIAGILGCAPATVRRRVNTEARLRYNATQREKKRREKWAQRAVAQRDRDVAVRNIGGTPAEAYALLRRAEQALDRACTAATDRQVRVDLNAALTRLHDAEDLIVRALGVA